MLVLWVSLAFVLGMWVGGKFVMWVVKDKLRMKGFDTDWLLK